MTLKSTFRQRIDNKLRDKNSDVKWADTYEGVKNRCEWRPAFLQGLWFTERDGSGIMNRTKWPLQKVELLTMEQENQKPALPLPDLLPGSEYETDDSDRWRMKNITGMAIAIVVHAHKDDIPETQRKAWFDLWENERKKDDQYLKKVSEFNYRRNPSHYRYIKPDTDSENKYLLWISGWLKKSLFTAPDWNRLYSLIVTKLNPSEGYNIEWWAKLRNICKRAVTNIDSFDPFAEIQKISEEYRKEQRPSKRAAKGTKTESKKKRFEHWKSPGDACFVIEKNRIKFHYNGEIKDLRIKIDSNTDKLLKWLLVGPAASQVINEKLCSKGTRPSDLVAYANKLLNEKIRKVGVVGVPENVEFVRYSKLNNDFESVLTIYPTRDEFDHNELQEPLLDDRGQKALDEAENAY